MARYLLTNQAVADLTAIWDYSCSVWSEAQADRYYHLLTGAFEEIANNPAAGKQYPAIDPALRGLRAGRHIVFYQMAGNGDIHIIRILHQRMDLRARLHGEE
jgi:toxin ParE1/3/4